MEHAYLWGIIDPEKARSLTRVTLKAETGGAAPDPAAGSLLAQNDGYTGLQRPPEPGTHSAKPKGWAGEEPWPTERLEPAARLGTDTGIEHAYLWEIIDPEKTRSLTRVTLKAETGGIGPGPADASLLAQNDGYTGLQRPPEPGIHSAKPKGWAGEEPWPTERLEPAATLGPGVGTGQRLNGPTNGLGSLAKGAGALIKGAGVSPSLGGHGYLVHIAPLAKRCEYVRGERAKNRPGFSQAIPPSWSGPKFALLNQRAETIRRVRGAGKVSIGEQRKHDSYKYKSKIGNFDSHVSHDIRLGHLDWWVGPSP
jgi:hypothetical protein